MKRFARSTALVFAGLMMIGCGRDDPMTGQAGSDLPPGPLQPLPSASAPDAPNCKVLEVGRGETRSDKDADFLDITFTNRSDADCTVHGYPTLTMREANGRSMGDRATLRPSGTARYLVLKPGETVTATVRYPKSDACKAGTSRIEVLIPGATRREFIAEDHTYCPGWTVSEIQRAWGEE
jgi:hypothetical protein